MSSLLNDSVSATISYKNVYQEFSMYSNGSSAAPAGPVSSPPWSGTCASTRARRLWTVSTFKDRNYVRINPMDGRQKSLIKVFGVCRSAANRRPTHEVKA